MLWKLLTVAESNFRKLAGVEQLKYVYEEREFIDGEMTVIDAGERRAA